MATKTQCECGRITGERCDWDGQGGSILIEHMPLHLRQSHMAAGNRGYYPANGAVRLIVSRECAENLVDDWTTIVVE